MADELSEREGDYYTTVEDGSLAVAGWSFDEIHRRILAEPSASDKALVGVHVFREYASGALAEHIEEAKYVDAGSFRDNFVTFYNRANGYGEQDLEINQALRF